METNIDNNVVDDSNGNGNNKLELLRLLVLKIALVIYRLSNIVIFICFSIFSFVVYVCRFYFHIHLMAVRFATRFLAL